MKIGYARVSTIQQNLDRQIAMLKAEGCDKILTDKLSGKNMTARPGLQEAIDMLGKDDVLVIAEWDRATRSMMDGVHLMQRMHEIGAVIKVLDRPALDLTTPIGRGFLAFLSAMAQDERERIVKRSRAGLLAAKARGVRLGPPSKLTPMQEREAMAMLNDPDEKRRKNCREVGAIFGVDPSTISRMQTRITKEKDNERN